MNFLLEKYNTLADKVITWEVESLLKPSGDSLKDILIELANIITVSMPEIGAGITIICAVGIMLTGNIPKWLGRWGVGMLGAIIWLLNA
jgi:hypothetical protein